jgi:hypothetical protein
MNKSFVNVVFQNGGDGHAFIIEFTKKDSSKILNLIPRAIKKKSS